MNPAEMRARADALEQSFNEGWAHAEQLATLNQDEARAFAAALRHGADAIESLRIEGTDPFYALATAFVDSLGAFDAARRVALIDSTAATLRQAVDEEMEAIRHRVLAEGGQ